MLLETLNALNQSGAEALESTLGTCVDSREVSLVREGHQAFPSLVTLWLKGCPLQGVHIGCDDVLAANLVKLDTLATGESGLQVLAERFLAQLLDKFKARNPRGTVEHLTEAPANLKTRGVRTFHFQLDTTEGRLFVLAEVPSRAELALAKGSEFLASMESIYLPQDWRSHQKIRDLEAVDNFLSYLYKTEGDLYLETPAGDGTATINSGLLIEICRHEDRPALKLITDFLDPSCGIPAPGAAVKACLGIGDRSLEFNFNYLAPSGLELDSGGKLPCALFSLPALVVIGQRRQTFRVPISGTVPVELVPVAEETRNPSPAKPKPEGAVTQGRLADLSFSGARIIAEQSRPGQDLAVDCRVECRLFFPDMDQPLEVMGVVRRANLSPADRDQILGDVGVEFLVSPGEERTGLDFIRQFVLEVQRNNLAQRLQVTNV